MTGAAWDWAKIRREVAEPLSEGDRGPTATLGKYRILREIARGAMGVVYEAEDAELRRRVALKILREFAGAKDVIRQRFQREALAAAKLSHPNVVRVYDAGEDGGRSYLVMELIEGHPLSEILGQRRYELAPMLRLLEKVARGVAAAHDAGIVHRDVKPANILVTAAGEPKIGDFGLAHWMESDDRLTKSGTPLGTPMYMAPEQVRGSASEIRPATDVYALGGILYEILTGRPPHTGENTAEIYSKIMGDDPVPPKRLSTRIPWELETICLKALEKDPARRYAGAREFADDLRRHLDGESILARPPGALSKGAKWMKRHRTWSVALAVALAGLGAVGVVAHAASSRHRRELAAIYYADFQRHEREGNRDAMLASERLVRIYDDGSLVREIERGGTLSVDSDPGGATIEILRYEEQPDGRLVAAPFCGPAAAPRVAQALPHGSYLLLLRKEGFREVRLPLRVERGGSSQVRVKLYTDEQIGTGFSYIPAGPFLAGGDPAAIDGEDRREAATGDYFISTLEITWREYLEFLKDLVRDEGAGETLKRSPRRTADGGSYVAISADGAALTIPSEFELDWPVFAISWADAEAYTRWRARREAREPGAYRLPTVDEWEKAARGADGRFFPWGNRLDWSFTVGSRGREGKQGPERAGSCAGDVSPYGVRDLGGNVAEMCAGSRDPGSRRLPVCGGAYSSGTANSFRSASRSNGGSLSVSRVFGFRIVRELPK